MIKTQTLSLGKHWNSFIEKKLEIGRYSSASEIIRDALRLLEEKDASSNIELIRSSLIEGEESGDAGKLNIKEIINSAKEKI